MTQEVFECFGLTLSNSLLEENHLILIDFSERRDYQLILAVLQVVVFAVVHLVLSVPNVLHLVVLLFHLLIECSLSNLFIKEFLDAHVVEFVILLCDL